MLGLFNLISYITLALTLFSCLLNQTFSAGGVPRDIMLTVFYPRLPSGDEYGTPTIAHYGVTRW